MKTRKRNAGRTICLAAAALGLLLFSCATFSPIANASSKDDRAAGAVLFHERGCEHCHGVEGAGTERGPDLSGVGRWLHKPDIALQIRNGGKTMPAFNDSLTEDEVNRLVAYLAAKRKKGVPRPESATPKS